MSAPDVPRQDSISAASVVSTPLLTTKLYAPRLHADVVPRSRLHAQLNHVFEVPLTLVVAPAGFGKTTVVIEWLHRVSHAAAWLSLDSGDNDPTTFLRYVIGALQTVVPKIGTTLLALLNTPQPPQPETVITLLINDLATLQEPVVLVLDDYHLVRHSSVHELVRLLVERLPLHVHLILTTREDPPLPLARLRSRRQLVEIRAPALRFTVHEAETFLRETMGLTLSAEQVAALETRTEGWIAGLHLVALALQERHDVADFVAQFTGSQRFIIEYLLEEVLNALPQHLRTFVLQISVLDRFCASLCDAVVLDEHSSHVPYSQVLIDEISRVNLFVIPLDDVGRWYRFHHLFADVLRARLQQGISPEQIVLLHRRSSQWHAEHGLFEQAIRHSLAANDVEQAIIILEQQVEGLITRGEVHSLMSWLALIPPESVKTRPDLLLAAAGVSLMHGNFAGMEEQLQQAERLLANSRTSVDTEDVVQGADRGWSTQGVETLRSLLARVQGDMPQAISLGRAALERLPKRFHFLRSTAAWNLGIAYWMSGDTNAAARVLHTLISDNQAPEHVHEYGVTVSSLGQMFALHGKLHEAERLYRRFLDHVAAIKVHVAAVGMVYIGLGDVLRERNDLDAATHYLTAGIELGRRFAGADVLVSGYVALVRVEQARGSTNSIREALAHVQLLAPGALFELTGPQYVRLWLAVGDVDAAAQWAARSGLQCNDVIEPAEEAVYVLFARVLLMQQDLPAAIHLLERLVESTVAGERYGLAIEGSVLLSLAYAQVGKKREALDMLQRALSYAEPEGYVRVFVDEGPPMTALLREAHARNIHPAYCGRLLAAFFDVKHPSLPPASTQPPHPRAATLVEPLNERELEILRLIAQGHSNQHIAGRLVLALSTVKWHVSNLYGKLGVGTRTQALARAAELELL